MYEVTVESGGITVCVVVSVTVKLDVTKTCRIGLAGKIVVVAVVAIVDCTEMMLVTVTNLLAIRLIVRPHPITQKLTTGRPL